MILRRVTRGHSIFLERRHGGLLLGLEVVEQFEEGSLGLLVLLRRLLKLLVPKHILVRMLPKVALKVGILWKQDLLLAHLIGGLLDLDERMDPAAVDFLAIFD